MNTELHDIAVKIKDLRWTWRRRGDSHRQPIHIQSPAKETDA